MKLSVVYDSEGTIVAASELGSPDEPQPHYVLGNELEVPSEFDGMELHEFLPQLRVDVANRKFVSVRDKGQR